METSTLNIDPRAIARLSDISAHIEEIGHTLGKESPTYRAVSESWLRASHQMWNLLSEGGSLSADGTRGLYIITPYGMHVGAVFFPDHAYRSAMTDQTSARVCIAHHAPWSDSESALCPSYVDGNDRGYCMVRTMMVPGSWSLHS